MKFETEVVYPRCCGMPQLEYGDIARVAEDARKTAADLRGPRWSTWGRPSPLIPVVDLMLKFEWPLIEPDDENVQVLIQRYLRLLRVSCRHQAKA